MRAWWLLSITYGLTSASQSSNFITSRALNTSTSSIVGAINAANSTNTTSIEDEGTDSVDGGMTSNQVTLIKSLLGRIANLSWEIGTHTQALIEFDYPDLSPFSLSSPPPFPVIIPDSPPYTSVNTIARSILSAKLNSTFVGPSSLVPDGSAGDPCSIGVSILIANWTTPTTIGNRSYASIVKDQLEFILTKVPRTPDGAISHRNDVVQLWADSVYMVPPFLAYYGAITNNATLIQAAYDQIRLYRNYLRSDSGLWRHIALGQGADPGYWATGNGWAAAGILRVYATIMNGGFGSQFSSQSTDLASWAAEIVEASFPLIKPQDNLFPNYLNAAGTNHSTFSDASATALLAASSYRLAQLGLGNSTVPAAAIARANLYSRINSTTGNLLPVVDPLSYTVEGKSSPEGLSFMLILDAAYRDWSDAGGDSIREREPPKAGGSGLPPITSARSGGSKLKLGLFGIFGIGIWILLV